MMAGARFAEPRKLDWVLEGIPTVQPVPGAVISGLAVDSRQIEANYAFFACSGRRSHGMEFVPQALDRGAVVIIAEPDNDWSMSRLLEAQKDLPVPIVVVSDLEERISAIAARYYGEPAKHLRVIAITGTNGKTSVSHFLSQALPESWRCGVIGTMGYGFPGSLSPGAHTTPDPVLMQAELCRLLERGANAVAVEVSSHALDQHRVDAVPFHTGVFTNLSRDHLDYHGTLTAYADAKASLFQREELRVAVINVDDVQGSRIASGLGEEVRLIACSRKGKAPHAAADFVRGKGLQADSSGIQVAVETSWGDGQFKTSLLGEFNVDNLLLVLGVLLGWGLPLDESLQRVSTIHTVAGRMQRLGGEGQPLVVVDYAHSPDALEKALKASRAHAKDNLICVFGCGGDRDRGKRPLMGAVAEALADTVIITDDNPRHEPAATIVDDILGGISDRMSVRVIHERAAAIRAAIQMASPDDVILIAGKGHESTQQVGDLVVPFSDEKQVQSILSERAA